MKPNTIKINEIFLSIPQEGFQSRNPTVFIRVSDGSLHIINHEENKSTWRGTVFTIEEVLEQVRHNPTQFVRIIGEDPLSQKGVYVLIENLIERKYLVSVEVNITRYLVPFDTVPKDVSKITEVRFEEFEILKNHIEHIHEKDCLNIYVNDFNEYRAFSDLFKKQAITCEINYIPNPSKVSTEEFAGWLD